MIKANESARTRTRSRHIQTQSFNDGFIRLQPFFDSGTVPETSYIRCHLNKRLGARFALRVKNIVKFCDLEGPCTRRFIHGRKAEVDDTSFSSRVDAKVRNADIAVDYTSLVDCFQG
jgi:hypothetical protein